jgi:phosphate transport system substrate-binding protein
MPAQDKQGRRLALIVGSSEYGDPTLQQLRAPGRDAADLAEVLRDPAIGTFDVRTLVNTPSDQLLRGIAQFCRQAELGDLVLVYLSCHGVLDDRGRLYYATINTERVLLSATAVAANWLNEQLDDCRARQQILLLDCCHSGAFAKGSKGSKGDDALALQDRFSGRGRVVLTASRATEYSFEGATVVGGGVRSVFTRAVVEGLRTGQADWDKDGQVTVDDLYHYVDATVRNAESRQTPARWAFGAEGDLVVAHSVRGPIIEPAPLPDDVRVLVGSPRLVARESGVKVLAELLDHGEPALALTARLTLQRISEEDLPRIAALARAAHDADHGQAVAQLEAREQARREAEQEARRQEAEEAAARRQQQIGQLQGQIRDRAAAQDWEAVLAVSDQLAALDPAAADPDGLASAAREQVTRRHEAEEAAARQRRQVEQLQGQLRERAAAAPDPGAFGSAEEEIAGTAVDYEEQATADRQQLGHRKETGKDAPVIRVDKTQPSRDGNKRTLRRGIRPAKLYFGIVGAIALASILVVSLLLATHSPERGKGPSSGSSGGLAGGSTSASSSSPSLAALSGTLNGSGSTFQTTFQETAIGSLKSIAPNLTVNYGSGGSGKGRTDLASGVVNFAGLDEPIPAAEQANFQGKTVLYFPVAIGPITVSYNLSGLSKPLQLSAPVLAQIFEGKITTWNDPAIAADNPGVSLPSTPVTIAVRLDSSGTTQNFSLYLEKAAGDVWTLGSSSTVKWPSTARAGGGDSGVAQIIKSTPGAIGYVDYADAKASGLAFVSIKNQAGNYVAPSPQSATAAASQATVQPNLTFSAVWAPGASSYPITYQSWVLAYETQPNAQTAKNLQGYIGYLLGAGQRLLPSLGYAPLPPNIDQMAKAQLSKIGM